MTVLGEHDVALCAAETDEKAAPETVSTASWGYMRLRRSEYDDGELTSWARTIGSQDWEEAFVFFKHEDAGAGPALAGRFLELMGEA
jgi:uncharacterized protein YecE (DUF72 family)